MRKCDLKFASLVPRKELYRADTLLSAYYTICDFEQPHPIEPDMPFRRLYFRAPNTHWAGVVQYNVCAKHYKEVTGKRLTIKEARSRE